MIALFWAPPGQIKKSATCKHILPWTNCHLSVTLCPLKIPVFWVIQFKILYSALKLPLNFENTLHGRCFPQSIHSNSTNNLQTEQDLLQYNLLPLLIVKTDMAMSNSKVTKCRNITLLGTVLFFQYPSCLWKTTEIKIYNNWPEQTCGTADHVLLTSIHVVLWSLGVVHGVSWVFKWHGHVIETRRLQGLNGRKQM